MTGDQLVAFQEFPSRRKMLPDWLGGGGWGWPSWEISPNSILHFSLERNWISLWNGLPDARELGGNGRQEAEFLLQVKCP